MTHEQETALHNFEALVRQLMMAYERLKRDNAGLREELLAAKEKLRSTEEQLEQAKRDYSTLRTARLIEVSGNDAKDARARIAQLIREVDKCIALINA